MSDLQLFEGFFTTKSSPRMTWMLYILRLMRFCLHLMLDCGICDQTFDQDAIFEQAVERQGKLLNCSPTSGKRMQANRSPPKTSLGDLFVYKHLESLSALRRYKVVDLRQSKGLGIGVACWRQFTSRK